LHIVAGVLGFVVTFIAPAVFFGVRLDKNQALIEQSIQTIQLNHEAHMQTALEEIAELKASDVDVRKKLDIDHDAIIRLLEKMK
jgi:hypothetical protein